MGGWDGVRRMDWGGDEGEGEGEGRSLMGREGEGEGGEGEGREGDLCVWGRGRGRGGRRAWLGLILIFWWPRLRIVACRSTW
jgi:hypothetical protein